MIDRHSLIGPDDSACPLIAVSAAQLETVLHALPSAQAAWARACGFRAEAGCVCPLPDDDGGLSAVLVGVTDLADPHLLGHLPMSLPAGRYRLHSTLGDRIDPAQAALSWGLGAYQFNRYRLARRAPAQFAADTAVRPQVARLLDAAFLVRDLINTPAEDMGPEHLAQATLDLAQQHAATVTVVEGDDLLRQGFPAIHAVGRASHRPPRLIELNWGDERHPRLVLVGKGVCFDTGGLNLKGADGMLRMKKDMGGAAHALALAGLVMASALPVRLKLLIAAVENSLGPNAFRPGEVLATRKGLSVEIGNTDAEGRLVLSDALTYAGEWQPDLICDFATLTGAARVALGPDLPALFGNDDGAIERLLHAGKTQRDLLWQMPLHAPYQCYLDSPIADLNNAAGTSHAGSVTAALFLSRFVPQGISWTHLDVYSWNDRDRPGRPAGGEAQGLRAFHAMLAQRYR